MFILPHAKRTTPHVEPHNFFIWGAPMSGKSYFCNYFPAPLVLNTDGNSTQLDAPSIQIKNERDANGNLTKSAIEQLDEILSALRTQNPTRPEDDQFKTLVLDVIDDMCVLIEQAICLKYHKATLSDFGYSKGYAIFDQVLQTLVMELKALPLNIIYVSRETMKQDGDATTYLPSLKPKLFNVINGNCDVVIRTQKIGNGKAAEYFRTVQSLRTMYKPEDISDPRVLQLLKSCAGMFTKKELQRYELEQKQELLAENKEKQKWVY